MGDSWQAQKAKISVVFRRHSWTIPEIVAVALPVLEEGGQFYGCRTKHVEDSDTGWFWLCRQNEPREISRWTIRRFLAWRQVLLGF